MRQTLKFLFTWSGRISRLQYLVAGVILVAIKYAIDYTIAAHFGAIWQPSSYFFPALTRTGVGIAPRELYTIMMAVTIPFFWIGISLTLKRLRDAGRSPAWVFLFFVMFANILLFTVLALLPSEPAAEEPAMEELEPVASSRWRWALFAAVLAATIGFPLVLLSTNGFGNYGWGLFLGVPFLTGFMSSWILNFKTLHSRRDSMLISVVTTFLIAFALIGFQFEGVICLLMAAPLAVPITFAGALLARDLSRAGKHSITIPNVTACIAILPLFLVGEHAVQLEPPVNAVTTSIVINAPVAAVWKNVIAFPPLAPPRELLFHTGIAYPIGAKIVGAGPGAVRYCRFSTGDFVEPITVWDENHLLAFNVSAEPPSMHELSPWNISPPHIEHNYMRSRHGQFRLVALNDHQTLLEGTTWYQDYFWPQAYWRNWSDGIIHRIHMRVLLHVKQQAEAEAVLAKN